MIVYSIGHSNSEVEVLGGLLQNNGIETLVDTRSQPYSRYSPQFNKEALQEHLESLKIQYVYMGDSLGGRPRDPQFYFSNGKVDYERLGAAGFYLDGIDRLLGLAAGGPLAFLCSEADFKNCHRYKLITRTLIGRGVEVCHILHTGDVVGSNASEFEPDQPTLF